MGHCGEHGFERELSCGVHKFSLNLRDPLHSALEFEIRHLDKLDSAPLASGPTLARRGHIGGLPGT